MDLRNAAIADVYGSKTNKLQRAVAPSTLERNRDRLDSWKQIAVYLDREVRSAQRWEKREGLPVHRHPHLKGCTVYAFKSEIDGWLRGRAQTLRRAHPVLKHSRRTGNGLNLPPDVMRQMLAAFRLWLALVESSRDLGDIEVGRVLALEQPEPGATRGYLLHCLDKTMRYTSSTSRALSHAIKELETIQTARKACEESGASNGCGTGQATC